MKTFFSIVLMLTCVTFLSAQKRTIKKVIKELNTTLEVYEKLTPHGQDYYPLDSLKVTEKDLIRAFDTPLKQTDSILNFDALHLIQSKVDYLLREALLHKKATIVDFSIALGDGLGIVKSEDNKLYNFALFEKTGGSYHSFLSWIFYLDGDQFIEFPVNDDWHLNQNDKPTVFEANGYDEIKSFFVQNKMRYLLFGSTKACGSCFVEFVNLVHFEDGEFILDFEYTVESRSSESKLFFDATNLSLSVFYDTDDLSTDCFCSDEELEERLNNDDDDDDAYSDILKNYSCNCLFLYSNGTFKLSKSAMELKKD